MTTSMRKALGALLAVAAGTASLPALSESPAASSPPAASASASAVPNATETARARMLLDRYYALSAESVAANAPSSEKNTTVAKPALSKARVKAVEAFEQVRPDAAATYRKPYVICGGGTAAWAAIDAMLREDSTRAKDILLITDEQTLPYNRTLLSKQLWKSSHATSSQTLTDAVEYAYKHVVPASSKVSVITDTSVIQLDVDDKTLLLANGTTVNYDKLLLSTGGQPRSPIQVSPVLARPDIAQSVSVFRTLSHFERLRSILSRPGPGSDAHGVVVIGGGFSGTELAVALSSLSKSVSLVVAEPGVLYRVLPRYLCEFLGRKIEERGVKIVKSAVVVDAKREHAEKGTESDVILTVESPDGDEVKGREVVVSIGIEPNVTLAENAGLEIDGKNGGVVVNDFMAAEPDVFAAGDMASFHDRTLGRRRVEHWDHAVVTGRIAGLNMVGKRARYALQSMFWCDLSNIGVNLTAVGKVESKLETVGVFNCAGHVIEEVPSMNEIVSGVVYYVEEGEIVGVVMWNPRKGSGALRRARAVVDARTSVSGLSDRVLGDLVNVDDGSFRLYVRTKA